MLSGARRLLHFLPPSKDRDDAAEVACVRAADRRMINARPASQIRRVQIFADFDLVVRGRRQVVWAHPVAFCSDVPRPVCFPKTQARNPVWIQMPIQSVKQFDKGLLTLPADQPVNIAGINDGLGIKTAEITSPNDWNPGVARLQGLRQGNGVGELRSWHHCERDGTYRVGCAVSRFYNGRNALLDIEMGEITVNDFPVLGCR